MYKYKVRFDLVSALHLRRVGWGSRDGLQEGIVGGLLLEVVVPEQRVALAAEGARNPRVLVRDAL
jgi:hypothetical protein